MSGVNEFVASTTIFFVDCFRELMQHIIDRDERDRKNNDFTPCGRFLDCFLSAIAYVITCAAQSALQRAPTLPFPMIAIFGFMASPSAI
jgi:hypothetical protein